MEILETKIQGVFIIQTRAIKDHRGAFSRLWCSRELERINAGIQFVQSSISYNERKGTLRGLHMQQPPSLEAKLVRCERGKIFDVALDLRRESPTFMEHVCAQLGDHLGNALYISPGIAHGFQTLDDACVVNYVMTDYHQPALAVGYRWNDPAFGIDWPLPVHVISERDAGYEDFCDV